MSRYDWPRAGRGGGDRDDPAGRSRFVSRRTKDFDPDGAHLAARGLGRRSGRPGAAPLATPSGRQRLWQPLGPLTVTGGQAMGTPRVTGRVNALAVRSDGARLYAASANGGIWYSRDAGASWVALGAFAPSDTSGVDRPAHRNACGAIRVVFGFDEADDVVYVGTGETGHADARPGSQLGGVGVLVGRGPAVSTRPDPWTREAPNLTGHAINRIAVEPGGTTVIAATTVGLFQRPEPAGRDVDWRRMPSRPFVDLRRECSDVLWTEGDVPSGRPARLWVWVREGSKAGLWVRAQGETDFKHIATAGSAPGVAVLATSTPPNQIWVLNDTGKNTPPALYLVAAAGRELPVATRVRGVPDILQAQGYDDIALAVDPTRPHRVALGGCRFDTTAPDGTDLAGDGAIVVGDVGIDNGTPTFGHPSPFTMVGVGVHPNIHDLVYSNGGNRLWASCDGGVFRSDRPLSRVGFFPCNNGLSIVQSHYLAVHPTCEGHVVAGLQNHGVITRLSNGVWENVGRGDGGGVVFDPLRPDRFLRQRARASWEASDGSVSAGALLTRGTPPNTVFARAESEASALYSAAAAIGHRRGTPAPAVPNVGQVIVGTHRVWYSENFGATWVTLPTGTDPLPRNGTQDAFGEPITVCRWQSSDVAWILGTDTLKRYSRTPGSDNRRGPGAWTVEVILRRLRKNKKDATSADGPLRKSAVWTDLAVNLDAPDALGGLPAQHGTKGALYLGTVGHPDDRVVDTLWWFDGMSRWFPTRLRTDPDGVPAPVTAIVCDPTHPDEVWVGTTVGVWLGIRTQVGSAPPSWRWSSRLNGLPEAPIEDLVIFNDGGLRLLRAAVASRGVWELRLDVSDVEDLTYVRAHDDDLRYRTRAVATKRDLTTRRSWHGSPDIRPRYAPGALPAPRSLPWRRAVNDSPSVLQRFQAALRARTRDPRIRATGVWDTYFNEVLRDLGAPILTSLPSQSQALPDHTVGVDDAFWNATMIPPHSESDPWDSGSPSEADLYDSTEQLWMEQLREGELTQTSCALLARRVKVEVVVHHRGLDPVAGDNVRVALMQWTSSSGRPRADFADHTTWRIGRPADGYVDWTASVNQAMNTDRRLGSPLGAEWRFVIDEPGRAHWITLGGQTLDSMHSGIASFDVDVTTLRNRVVLLVAIIHVVRVPARDLALAPATLEDLAMSSPNVAVRSIRVV